MHEDSKSEENKASLVGKLLRARLNEQGMIQSNSEKFLADDSEVDIESKAPLADEILDTMGFITDLLITKNAKYGNSAIEPVYIFSGDHLSPLDQIFVQIDNKLARIKRGDKSLEDEDVLLDLVGYLVLALVARRRQET